MSNSNILGLVGYGIGYYFGGPLGGAIGGAIGGAVGASFDSLPDQYGPRIGDRTVQSSAYGQTIPYLFGTPRLAGNIIWAPEIEEVPVTNEVGGKGGPSQSTTTYSYYGTFAVMFGMGEAKTVRKIWGDSVLLYDIDSHVEGIEAYFAVYPGNEEQMPDPTIEAAMGVGQTPAYRGYFYIVFNRLPLEKFGNRLPNMTVEVEMVEATVPAAITRLSLDSGLTETDFDLSALGDMPLRGYIVNQQGAARAAIEQLATTFLFAASEVDDMLVYVPRGGQILASIPLTECGAGIDQAADTGVQLTRAQEMDLPKQYTVTAPDPDRLYQPGTQPSERIVTRSGQVAQWATAAALTSAEGRALANALIYDAWASREAMTWSLPRKRMDLAPTDVVMLGDRRARVLKRTYDGGVVNFEGISDDPDVLNQDDSQGIVGTFTPPVVARTVDTEAIFLDTSLLRDEDNGPGFYVAAWGEAPYWRGGQIFMRSTGSTWNSKTTVLAPGPAVGTTTTALPDAADGWVFDELSRLNVMLDNGALSSATRDAVLRGANTAAVEGPGGAWEIIQFRTAFQEMDGSYTLRGLLRGRFGTEWAAAGHDIGNRFVMIDSTLLRTITIANTDVGTLRAFKAVSSGAAIADAVEQDVTITAERLKPRSPVDLRAVRAAATGDITLTWKRRSRLATRFTGAGGINVPLGETSERYEVEIFDSSFTTLKRTVSGLTAAQASYSAADQTADFGGPQATVYARVYQLSETLGRGHELQGSA